MPTEHGPIRLGACETGVDPHPVGLGHVKSLSRPCGNFTGFTYVDPEMIGKWRACLGIWCRS